MPITQVVQAIEYAGTTWYEYERIDEDFDPGFVSWSMDVDSVRNDLNYLLKDKDYLGDTEEPF